MRRRPLNLASLVALALLGLARTDARAAGPEGILRITSVPTSVTVQVDGAPGQTTPLTLRLAPGKHVVVASAPEYESASRDIDVTKGTEVELAIALRPRPAPPPAGPPAIPTPAEDARAPLVVGGVALGLAAVGLAVGTAFGVRALEAKSDFDRAPTQALADTQGTSSVIADGSLGGAVVAAVTGAVLLAYGRAPAAPAAARVRVAPLPVAKAQGAAIVWSF